MLLLLLLHLFIPLTLSSAQEQIISSTQIVVKEDQPAVLWCGFENSRE